MKHLWTAGQAMLQPKVERSVVVHMQETRVSSVAGDCMLSVEQQESCLAHAVLCSQH